MPVLAGMIYKQHSQFNLIQILMHRNFIELPSRKFKTANVLARRTEFLPITAVCFSISRQPWISSYICARKHFSLTIAGKLFQPLLPQMIRNDLSIHELPSRVITKLLRRLFRDDALRAHSLKHTLLSFAAKRGLSPHDRKLLGYHLDRSEVSLATYSRDMLSDPLRQLSVLLLEIQHGTFQTGQHSFWLHSTRTQTCQYHAG